MGLPNMRNAYSCVFRFALTETQSHSYLNLGKKKSKMRDEEKKKWVNEKKKKKKKKKKNILEHFKWNLLPPFFSLNQMRWLQALIELTGIIKSLIRSELKINSV
jgi:hypothetical protein